MNPPMHKRVSALLVSAGLTAGYTIQSLIWTDTGDLAERFIVVRPNGGGDIDQDAGAEYYILVDLVTAKSTGEIAKSEADVQSIIEYVKANPITDPCVGQIRNMGGIPTPIQTTEGRLVWRLQFSCLYGE